MSFAFSFRKGMGPWVPRHTPSADVPTGEDCAAVNDGRVVLRVKANPLRTGHIWVPPEEFSFSVGYAEARLRFLGDRGVHCAFWLQPPIPYFSPAHHEVDIAECFGGRGVHHGLWHRPEPGGPEVQPYHSAVRIDRTKWHTYGCEVRADGYTWTIDDKEVGATKEHKGGPFQTLILSMLADNWERKYLDMTDLRSHRFQADWVRVS